MRTDAYEAIPEGTKILVDKKVLVEVLEDCWTLLFEVQLQKQRLDDAMKGLKQVEPYGGLPGGWTKVGPSLDDYGVPATLSNDLTMMLIGMGESARQACEKTLFLRKAVMDKPGV